MKHIKEYGDSKTPEYIKEEIRDISDDITDDGFVLSYSWDKISRYKRTYFSYISISKFDKDKSYPIGEDYMDFSYKEISDFVDRVRSYLNTEEYYISVKFVSDDLEDVTSDNDVSNYFIIDIYKRNI